MRVSGGAPCVARTACQASCALTGSCVRSELCAGVYVWGVYVHSCVCACASMRTHARASLTPLWLCDQALDSGQVLPLSHSQHTVSVTFLGPHSISASRDTWVFCLLSSGHLCFLFFLPGMLTPHLMSPPPPQSQEPTHSTQSDPL